MFEPTSTGPDLPDPRPPFFEAFSPLRLILLGLSLVFLQQVLLSLVNGLVSDLFLAILVAVAASLVAVPVWLISRHEGGIRQALRMRRLPVRQVGWLVLLTGGLVLAVDYLGTWNTKLVPIPQDFVETMARLDPVTPRDWVFSLLGLCLVVPLGEEIVFRGIIQRGARLALRGETAAILCGLLFGVLHFEPWYVAPLGLMGIVLGLVYEVTGTLMAPILVHALYNGIVVANQAIVHDDSLVSAAPSRTETLLTLASVILAVFAFRRLRNCVPWDDSSTPESENEL